MIADVANRNLNSRGGSARVCLSVIGILRKKGYRINLITKTPVHWEEVAGWNGTSIGVDREYELEPFRMDLFGKYQKLLALVSVQNRRAGLFVNTSADFFPFLYERDSCNIAYCHFPVVRKLAVKDYPDKYRGIPWRLYFEPYVGLLNRAIEKARDNVVFLTNSVFSKEQIRQHLGVDAQVVYPPVDVKKFQAISSSAVRGDRIVTVSRLDPSKGVELVVEIARMLPRGIKWDIVGSLDEGNAGYLSRLRDNVETMGLNDRVRFIPNASDQDMMSIMSGAKVYFHPKRGEHFGISIVEAMAAGLVPVIWNYGGATEFVPREFQFSTPEEAPGKIATAMSAGQSLRNEMVSIASQFSEERFQSEMTNVIDRSLNYSAHRA